MLNNDEQAFISYIGTTGIPIACTDAIIDLLGRGKRVEKIKLLSSPKDKYGNASHGFMITFEVLGWFIVLPGYASGYSGSGPNHLSQVLSILRRYGFIFPEINLDSHQFRRLVSGSLTDEDIGYIYDHPKRYCGDVNEYIYPEHLNDAEKWSLLEKYDSRLPLPILHPELQKYAIAVFDNPEATLREIYTKLEQRIKKLADIESFETKYIEIAIGPKKGKLKLSLTDDYGQQDGFKFLIKGLTQLHRNQLMHNPESLFHHKQHNIISEFLLLNHVYRLSDYLIKNETADLEESSKSQ